jgi:carotenoid 1,2-hydratase
MVGSVFSPYYAWARRRGRADPLDHCAVNVCLYGRGGKRWALTERGRAAMEASSSWLAIGPSALCWNDDTLTIDIEEITVPLPSRLTGRIRLHPESLADYQAPLDAAVRHRWSPIAPCARVEVEMTRPRLRWSGPGYFDSNAGDEPLESAFSSWDWSRAPHRGGTTVLYHVDAREAGGANLAVHFDAAGQARPLESPAPAALPCTSIWRIPRGTRGDAGQVASVVETLEDTPFYARSVVSSRLQGERVTSFHESLSLDRFRQRWVQMLLPFRMPRITR